MQDIVDKSGVVRVKIEPVSEDKTAEEKEVMSKHCNDLYFIGRCGLCVIFSSECSQWKFWAMFFCNCSVNVIAILFYDCYDTFFEYLIRWRATQFE